MNMSTVENLFVQIFERKNRIIEQVKQQTELYNQHLLSKLIIDGINPPSWLLNTHQSLELNKEEWISEILLPRPRLPTVGYSSARCSLHKWPAVADENENPSRGTSLEIGTSNKSIFPDGTAITAVDPDNNKQFALNCVPELDVSVNSPLDQVDGRLLNNAKDLDLSLARLQRSKSRQKALQIRNSAQAEEKGCSSLQNNCDFAPIVIGLSTSDQVNHNHEVHKWSESGVVSDGTGGCKESAERNHEDQERGITLHTAENSKQKTSTKELECMVDSLKVDSLSDAAEKSHTPKVDNSSAEPCEVGDGNGGFRESDERNYEDQERGINLLTGEDSKHNTSTLELECTDDFLKVDSFTDVAEKSNTPKVDNSSAAAQKSHSNHKHACNFASTGINLSASQLIDLPVKSDHLLESFPVGSEASKSKEFVEVNQHDGIEVDSITRSRSSAKQLNCINHSVKVDGSTDAVQKNDNIQTHTTGSVSGRSLEVASTSYVYKPIVKSYPEIYYKNVNHCGRITRSRSMAQKLPSFGDDSHAKISTFSNRASTDVFAPAIGGSSEVVFNNLDLLGSVNPSLGLDHKSTKTECTIGNEVTTEHVDASDVAPSGAAGFTSADSEKSSQKNDDTHRSTGSKAIIPYSNNNDTHNQQEKAEAVMGGSPTSRSRTSNSNPKVGFERLVFNPPPDCFMPMKPKQLDFDDMEECNLKKTFTPNFEEKSLKATYETSNTSVEPTPEMKISGSPVDCRCSSEQATPELEISSKLDEVPRSSFVSKIKEPAGTEMNGPASNMSEHFVSRNTVYEPRGRQFSRQSPYLHYDKTLSNDVGLCDAETHHDKFNPKESDNSMVELHFKVGGNNCEGNAQSVPASYVSNTTIAATPCFSNLTKKLAGDSQDCSVENFEIKDPTSISPDAKRQSCMPNDPNLPCFDGENNHRDVFVKCDVDMDSHQKENDTLTMSPLQSGRNDDETLNISVSSRTGSAREPLLFEGRIGSAKMDSWPQVKRKNIEARQTDGFSAFPKSQTSKLYQMQMDAISSNFNALQEKSDNVVEHIPLRAKSSNVSISELKDCHLKERTGFSPELQKEVDAKCCEQQNNSTVSASSSDDTLVRVFSSLFTEPAEKNLGIGEQNELLFYAEKFSDEQVIPDLLHLEKKVKVDNPEDLACLERKSHTGEQSLYSPSLVCSSPQNNDIDIADADQSRPVLEGFIIDTPTEDGETDIAQLGINYDNLDFPRTTIERASILEQICKSASAHTPLPHFTSALGLHHTQNLYQSLPNGLLEHLDLRSSLFSEEDVNKQLRASCSSVDEVKNSVRGITFSDYPPSYGCQFGWRSGSQNQSPVGKFRERISSHSSSSEKCLSSNPELMCFPIEEDPNSSEENEAADEVAGKIHHEYDSTVTNSQVKRLPLADVSDSCLNASVSAAERFHGRGSLDSVNADVSCTAHHDKAKRQPGSGFRNMSRAKVKRSSFTGAKGIKQGKESFKRSSRPKLSAMSSIKRDRQKLSEKGPRYNNIVSTVTSFIPLVQQKQAAAVCIGKRDIKVKALEAAEAAKRLEEKRENERKMRKEAMKHERARLEQENSKQMEFHKKKKEEEKKKKEADAKARKRQREEDEKNEKERKRKRVEEARRQQREQEDKTHAKRAEKDKGVPTIDEKAMAKNKSNSDMEKCQTENERVGKAFNKPESENKPADTLRNDSFQATPGTHHISHNYTDHEKATYILGKPDANTEYVAKTSQEKSYEISPYQCSDDEEDEDEDLPIRKFVPSWASKPNVANALQQEIDPDSIFPPESFCSMDEVLVPRKVQQKPVAI